MHLPSNRRGLSWSITMAFTAILVAIILRFIKNVPFDGLESMASAVAAGLLLLLLSALPGLGIALFIHLFLHRKVPFAHTFGTASFGCLLLLSSLTLSQA